MSIEQALKDLTEATLANTTALNKLLASTATVAGTPTAASSDADDTADTTTTTTTDAEAPKRERGKPSPGKSKRTAAEVAEDKAADEADAAAAGDQGGDAVTFADVQANLVEWLGEFGQEQDKPVKGETDAQKAAREEAFHPETKARKAAVKAVLNKLTGSEDGKLGMIKDDAAKIAKLQDWIENKAKVADKGFGVGRLAADPEPAGDDDSADGDDELDI